jgi:hypothetical protein
VERVSDLSWLALALLAAIVLVQGFALLELIRQVVDLRGERAETQDPKWLPESVPVGSTLPDRPAGLRWAISPQPVDWSKVLGSAATALVFLHTSCSTCYLVASELRRAIKSTPPDWAIVPILLSSSRERAERFLDDAHLPNEITLVDDSGQDVLARAINLHKTPVAVLLRGDRIIGAATVFNGGHALQLLRDVTTAAQSGAELDSQDRAARAADAQRGGTHVETA